MDLLQEIQSKQRKKRALYFSPQSPCLQELSHLLSQQSRRTIILWALDLAEADAAQLQQRYPQAHQPRAAIQAARDWAAGRCNMPAARQAILACHALAKTITAPADIALCHAIGQACSVVHTPKHALGLPIYELTALVHQQGCEDCLPYLNQRLQIYLEKLLFWQAQAPHSAQPWAEFLPAESPKEAP